MSHFVSSTHCRNWMFTPTSLQHVQEVANKLGRQSALKRAAPESPRCFACEQSRGGGDPLLHTTEMPSINGESETAAPEAGVSPSDLLTAEEEKTLKTWHLNRILQICGRDAEAEKLRRSEKVQAGARAFFQRFYLSNSILEYDPKLIMLAAIFMTSKIEDEIIVITELEKHTNTPEGDILLMEPQLLAGVRFNLRVFTPYPPLLGLVEQVHKYAAAASNGGTGGSAEDVNSAMANLHGAARELLDLALSSDLPFIYPPARLALGALAEAVENVSPPPIPGGMNAFLKQKFGKDENYGALVSDVAAVRDAIRSIPREMNVSLLKQANKKLKRAAVWAPPPGPEREKRKTASEEAQNGEAGGERKKKKRKSAGGESIDVGTAGGDANSAVVVQ